MNAKKETRHQRAHRLWVVTKRRMYSMLDDQHFYEAMAGYSRRYNFLLTAAYPGESVRSAGDIFNEWYETHVFESRL